MRQFSEPLFWLVSQAVKCYGTYDPDVIFPYFEEHLYPKQVKPLWDFLYWVHSNNKTFGSENYKDVFNEYKNKGETYENITTCN